MTDKEFIAEIAPIVQKYAKQYGYKVCSAVIAQACIESAYGRSSLSAKYNNFFGLKASSDWKGAVVSLKTNEEYRQGVLTPIYAKFRVYASMDDGVKGYYDFIQYPRYANLKHATTAQQYLEYIKADGYATAYTYVNTCMRVVYQHDLTQYDTIPDSFPVSYAGIVTADALRVRTGWGTNYPVANVGGHDFLLPRGVCVAFEAECNGWAKLAGYNGWCSLSYIAR